jgi:hypothetical protein
MSDTLLASNVWKEDLGLGLCASVTPTERGCRAGLRLLMLWRPLVTEDAEGEQRLAAKIIGLFIAKILFEI